MTEFDSQKIANAAQKSLETGVPWPILGTSSLGMSERCVEIPWVSAHIGSPKKLLDVGWTMSPYEWISVLLAVEDQGCLVTGLDIVDPMRVRHRYSADQMERVMQVPMVIADFLADDIPDSDFDVITCVSTLEHFGFDEVEPTDTELTVFKRHESPDDVPMNRESDVDRRFLDLAFKRLVPGGVLLLTVPAGAGKPILHRDSLGLYTFQFEYGIGDWSALTSDPRFEVSDETFFRVSDRGWVEAESIDEVTKVSSELMPFATGCAVVALKKRDLA